MGTLLDLKNRIASDLTRDDLTSQIDGAVRDAIKFYERERFWFNQTRSLTFNTVPGQVAYGSAANTAIPTIIQIDHLFLPQGNSIYPLDRYEAADFEILENGSTGGGRPIGFTYIDKEIRLWPVPNSILTLRLHAHYRLPYPDDGDTNAWTDDCEELIRSHAKMLLYLDLLEDNDGVSRMQNKIPVLLDFIRSETTGRMATGRIRGTDF